MGNEKFYTFNEYMKKENNSLTASMEDYLEMIYRLFLKTGFVRIHELSDALNVQPPSATKMVQRLSELNLINYEKYGIITLKDEGKLLGEILIKRHNVIESFLRMLGVPESNILQEAEKMEHTISTDTVRCLEIHVNFFNKHPDIMNEYIKFKNSGI